MLRKEYASQDLISSHLDIPLPPHALGKSGFEAVPAVRCIIVAVSLYRL